MNATTLETTRTRADRGSLPAWARLLLSQLERLREGQLVVRHRGGTETFGAPAEDGLGAEIEVLDDAFWGSVLFGGTIGAGEAFVRGEWRADDLTRVVRLLVRNQSVMNDVDGRWSWVTRPVQLVWHRLNRNTSGGSRRNIAAHYDLSNDFFRLVLDESMTYSCALYERPDMDLAEAQAAKIDALCRKLDLREGERLLEIGTGWGALALHAAREYGARVTTTTISRRQHELARERFRAAGLEGRIELLSTDYRALEGSFDKLVSVEMIEAVGHQYYGSFFGALGRLLKPDGLGILQAITISDQHFDSARRSVDFIQRYIFPGSNIPSVTALVDAATRRSDLRLVGLDDITEHYVPTLAAWRRNMRANEAEIRALGFGDDLLRTWEFYLAYCEGGFAERHIGDVHLSFARPRWRGPAPIRP